VRRWAVGGELRRGVLGLPALSFSDGVQQEYRSRWYVRISRCGAFPEVAPVVRGVARLDAGVFEELPNEFAAFGAMIVKGLVGPLARHQHPSPGNTQVIELVGLALAPSGRRGVSSAVGLDAVEQPDRASG